VIPRIYAAWKFTRWYWAIMGVWPACARSAALGALGFASFDKGRLSGCARPAGGAELGACIVGDVPPRR